MGRQSTRPGKRPTGPPPNPSSRPQTRRRRAGDPTAAPPFTKGAYFLGKALWAKGHSEFLDLPTPRGPAAGPTFPQGPWACLPMEAPAPAIRVRRRGGGADPTVGLRGWHAHCSVGTTAKIPAPAHSPVVDGNYRSPPAPTGGARVRQGPPGPRGWRHTSGWGTGGPGSWTATAAARTPWRPGSDGV